MGNRTVARRLEATAQTAPSNSCHCSYSVLLSKQIAVRRFSAVLELPCRPDQVD